VRTPVHHQFTVHLGNGEMIFNKAVSIPAKKRLMIEHVSGTLSLPSPQLAFVSLQTTAFQIDIPGGTTTGTHFFPTTVQRVGSSNEIVFGMKTRIRTIGGNVNLTVQRISTSGNLDGQVTISGELVDAP
jgi:hypothetical protein